MKIDVYLVLYLTKTTAKQVILLQRVHLLFWRYLNRIHLLVCVTHESEGNILPAAFYHERTIFPQFRGPCLLGDIAQDCNS